MNNTTYSPKAGEIERKWYIIDAAGKPVGRVATEVAKLLRGFPKGNDTFRADFYLQYVIIVYGKISQR